MATSTVSCKHEGGPIPSRKLRKTVQRGWNYLHFFDIAKYLSPNAFHVKDKQALSRAAVRRRTAREARANKAGTQLEREKDEESKALTCSVLSRPTLDQEMVLFKAIVRHIAKHELPNDQSGLFRMENRSKLRRLAQLGVTGNQPAIAAYCKITEEETHTIEEAIMQQKIGSNGKNLKAYEEQKARTKQRKDECSYDDEDPDNLMLFKRTRIAKGAPVRWSRKTKDAEDQQISQSTSRNNDVKPNYKSRLISCTKCGQQQETHWMQLRTEQGYRALHCKTFGKQERTAGSRCQCGLIWHLCPLHGIDPEVHRSKKAPLETKQQKLEHAARNSLAISTRRPRKRKQPPDIADESAEGTARCSIKQKQARQQYYLLEARRHAKEYTQNDTTKMIIER